jgi:hypothetical protein
MRVVVGAFVLLMSLAQARFSWATDEKDRPAELKVLDRWVGDWDMEITVKPSRELPQGSKSTFKMTTRWALNNRFVRCDAQGRGEQGDRKFDDAFCWTITHDPRSKSYSDITLWSTVTPGGLSDWGLGRPSSGTWDEKDQILAMRSEDRDHGLTTISVTQWVDADTHKFALSTTDAAGRVVVEMSGTAKRIKKQ